MNILKTLIFLLVTIVSGALHAQQTEDNTINNKDTINVVNSHSNSLYAGIDNYIEINRKNLPYKKILVEVAKGMAMEDENQYIVMVGRPGTTIISVYQYDKGDTILCFKKCMQIKAVPAPFISINGSNLSELPYITKGQLIKINKFEVHVSKDFVDDSEWFTIKSITIGYTYGQQYISKTCDGSKLTDEILSAINHLAPGKEIAFAFVLEGSGDMYKRLEPIRLKLY